MRILITLPSWRGPRTGTALPAFGRGRYHVRLDGETEKAYTAKSCPYCDVVAPSACRACGGGGRVFEHRHRELLFTSDEMVREDGGRL